MKNNPLPLILAVLLGLAAVIGVKRMLTPGLAERQDKVAVVIASRDIREGEVLADGDLVVAERQADSLPANHVGEEERTRLIGQAVRRPIKARDYVLYQDIAESGGLRDAIASGKWAMTLDVDSGGIARQLRAGDEIAILATLGVSQQGASDIIGAEGKVEEAQATFTLFPSVKVLQVSAGATPGAAGQGQSHVIVGLDPQDAQLFVAAKQKAELTVALRKPGDPNFLSRIDNGKVDESSFAGMLAHLAAVTPGAVPKPAPAATPGEATPAAKRSP